MKHVFWLVENALCGRPGPNSEPWQPREFHAAGIGAVLSVNGGESVYQDELQPFGIDHLCVPLAANAPPESGELELCVERLPLAYEFAQQHIEHGRAVLVHCRHGKDRTGLFMAYYLVKRYQMTADEAVDRVKAVRPIAMTAVGWEQFVPEVLRAFQSTRKTKTQLRHPS